MDGDLEPLVFRGSPGEREKVEGANKTKVGLPLQSEEWQGLGG